MENNQKYYILDLFFDGMKILNKKQTTFFLILVLIYAINFTLITIHLFVAFLYFIFLNIKLFKKKEIGLNLTKYNNFNLPINKIIYFCLIEIGKINGFMALYYIKSDKQHKTI
jgi:hypothetical protein